MKKLVFNIFLSCFGLAASAQVFQTNNIPYKFMGVKADSLLIIPSGIDTPNTSNPKWATNTTGALYLRTTDSSLWGKINNRYSRITGGGSSTTIGTFSTTGNANGLSISSGVLTAHAATATTPGMVSTGAQTWAGEKTFNDRIKGLSNTSNSIMELGSLEFSSYAVNNSFFGDNIFYNGSNFVRRSAGYGGLFYFYKSTNAPMEGQFRLYNTSTAGSALGPASDSAQLRLTLNGNLAVGYPMSSSDAFFTGAKMRLNENGQLIIGSNTPNASAQLDITSTTRGFLPPRLTATQRNAIGTPAAGLMVYDTDSSRYMLYGSAWKGLAFTDATSGGSYSSDSMGLRYTGTTTRNFVSIGAGNPKGYAAGTAVNGRNIAIGDSSLRYITTGTSNIGIGYQALLNTTTGVENVAIGHLSGVNTASVSNTTDGGGHTSMGFAAGQNTNAANVAVGWKAMQTNTSIGRFNTAVGASAMRSTTGANQANTAIGSGAGVNISGSVNTILGANAAQTLTGTANIALGSGAVMPSTSGSNQVQIWIGANEFGGGYNAITKFSGGQTLINNTTSTVTTATTSAALEINGTTGSILVPRLNTTQTNALTPVAGMVHYNSDSSRLVAYNGTAWKGLAYTDAGGGGGGSTTSASGTGISLVNGSSLIKRLKAGFNTIVTDNTDSVTISRDTLTQTLTDGATITYSATAGVSARVTLGGNRTLSITNMNNGMYLTLLVVQDGTGGRTLTLPAGTRVINGGAGAVTLSSAANAQDILTFFEINNVIYCNVGRNYN